MTNEILDRYRINYLRDTGLEGLFGGGEDYALSALGLVDPALRMVPYERHNAVYPQLGGFFHKPFEAVVVLGGAAA